MLYSLGRQDTTTRQFISYYDKDLILSQAKTIAGMQVSNESAMAFAEHVNNVAALDFEETVRKRTLIDLSTRSPLDSILYSYITNFIVTIDDGMYLFDFMEMNKNESSSAFIGFILGELYLKFTDEEELTEGLKYVIDKLLGNSMDKSQYPNTSEQKLTKAFEKDIPSIDTFQERAAEYLL